jgi:hypothetical protein
VADTLFDWEALYAAVQDLRHKAELLHEAGAPFEVSVTAAQDLARMLAEAADVLETAGRLVKLMLEQVAQQTPRDIV